MKKIKVITILIGLAITAYLVVRFVNVNWWCDAAKEKFLSLKSENKKEIVGIYTYKDKNGITVISDKNVPEKDLNNVKKVGSYERNLSE